MSLSCIVMKPGALDLARHAHKQGCLALNLGKGTYQWAVKQGWPTPDTHDGFIKFFLWLISGKDWTKEFKKKAIENEENLRLAIYESGADLMVPNEIFMIENGRYVIKPVAHGMR